MKAEATLYFTQPADIDVFLRAPEESKIQMVHVFADEQNMESIWTKVGTATVEYTFLPTDGMQQSAVAGIDKQIEQVTKEMLAKLNELKARRSELLCLEAPKNV